jgi:NitT/TauT family transport system substrate-binding protein
MIRRRSVAINVLAAFLSFAPLATAQVAKLEKTKVSIALPGTSSIMHVLPLNVALTQGFFAEEGIEVEAIEFAGGAKALEAAVGRSVDLVAGSVEQAMQLQEKGVDLPCIALFIRSPAIAIAIRKDKAAAYKSPKDLKGMTIGVSAVGISSTHNFLNIVLARNGLKPADVSVIGVGVSAGAVAAVRNKELDAISNPDPVITELVRSGDVVIAVDARTEKDLQAVYGGFYPNTCLHGFRDFVAKNPNTTQAVVNGLVHAMKWMRTATPDQILAKLPDRVTGKDRQLYREVIVSNLAVISPDGMIRDNEAETVFKIMSEIQPGFSKVDIKKAYDNTLVTKAQQKFK